MWSYTECMSQRAIIGLTVVLVVLLLGAGIGLIWIKQFKQPLIAPPSNNVNTTINSVINTPTDRPSNSQCGGIAGILCPTGYTCVYPNDATYPDVAGQCVLNDL